MRFFSLYSQRNVACFLTGGLTVPENKLIRAVSDERLHYPCHRDQSEIGAIQIIVNEEDNRPPTQLEIDKLLVLMAQLSKRAQQQ